MALPSAETTLARVKLLIDDCVGNDRVRAIENYPTTLPMFPFPFICYSVLENATRLGITLFRDKKLHVPDKDFRFDPKLSSSYRDRFLNETNVSIIPAKSAHLQLNELSQKPFTWVKRRNKRGPMELVSVSILPDDRSIFLRQASPAKRKLDARMRVQCRKGLRRTNRFPSFKIFTVDRW